jgi:hypothetical protein
VACIGLFDDRGNTGVFALPRVNANMPSALSAATAPRCRDSVNPDRITSASTGLADMSCRITCTLSRVPAPVRAVLPVDLTVNPGVTPYLATLDELVLTTSVIGSARPRRRRGADVGG